jgi:hypothetical protein
MIRYNGKDYEEFTSDKVIIFDTPQPVLVWDEGLKITGEMVAYIPACQHPVITSKNSWLHCARPCAVRRVTNKELAIWCAKGNGQVRCAGAANTHAFFSYALGTDDDPVTADYAVKRFDDEDWHLPTVEYLGIEE